MLGILYENSSEYNYVQIFSSGGFLTKVTAGGALYVAYGRKLSFSLKPCSKGDRPETADCGVWAQDYARNDLSDVLLVADVTPAVEGVTHLSCSVDAANIGACLPGLYNISYFVRDNVGRHTLVWILLHVEVRTREEIALSTVYPCSSGTAGLAAQISSDSNFLPTLLGHLLPPIGVPHSTLRWAVLDAVSIIPLDPASINGPASDAAGFCQVDVNLSMEVGCTPSEQPVPDDSELAAYIAGLGSRRRRSRSMQSVGQEAEGSYVVGEQAEAGAEAEAEGGVQDPLFEDPFLAGKMAVGGSCPKERRQLASADDAASVTCGCLELDAVGSAPPVPTSDDLALPLGPGGLLISARKLNSSCSQATPNVTVSSYINAALSGPIQAMYSLTLSLEVLLNSMGSLGSYDGLEDSWYDLIVAYYRWLGEQNAARLAYMLALCKKLDIVCGTASDMSLNYLQDVISNVSNINFLLTNTLEQGEGQATYIECLQDRRPGGKWYFQIESLSSGSGSSGSSGRHLLQSPPDNVSMTDDGLYRWFGYPINGTAGPGSLSQYLFTKSLSPVNTARRRTVTVGGNQIIGGLFLHQIRHDEPAIKRGLDMCEGSEVTSFIYRYSTQCILPHSLLEAELAFLEKIEQSSGSAEGIGMDPVFSPTSSLFHVERKLNPSDYYNTSADSGEINYMGYPYGFFSVDLPGHPHGYPIIVSVDLGESRLAKLMKYIQDGVYLNYDETKSLTAKIATFNQDKSIFGFWMASFNWVSSGGVEATFTSFAVGYKGPYSWERMDDYTMWVDVCLVLLIIIFTAIIIYSTQDHVHYIHQRLLDLVNSSETDPASLTSHVFSGVSTVQDVGDSCMVDTDHHGLSESSSEEEFEQGMPTYGLGKGKGGKVVMGTRRLASFASRISIAGSTARDLARIRAEVAEAEEQRARQQRLDELMDRQRGKGLFNKERRAVAVEALAAAGANVQGVPAGTAPQHMSSRPRGKKVKLPDGAESWSSVTYDLMVLCLMALSLGFMFWGVSMQNASDTPTASRYQLYDADLYAQARYLQPYKSTSNFSASADIPVPGAPGRWKLEDDLSGMMELAAVYSHLKKMVDIETAYMLIQCIVMVMLLGRVIMLASFQPRLAIIPYTLIESLIDLLHLLVTVCIVLMMWVMLRVVVFGASTTKSLSTIGGCLEALLLAVFTMDWTGIRKTTLDYLDSLPYGQQQAGMWVVYVEPLLFEILFFCFIVAILVLVFSRLKHSVKKEVSLAYEVKMMTKWTFQHLYRHSPSNKRIHQLLDKLLERGSSKAPMLWPQLARMMSKKVSSIQIGLRGNTQRSTQIANAFVGTLAAAAGPSAGPRTGSLTGRPPGLVSSESGAGRAAIDRFANASIKLGRLKSMSHGGDMPPSSLRIAGSVQLGGKVSWAGVREAHAMHRLASETGGRPSEGPHSILRDTNSVGGTSGSERPSPPGTLPRDSDPSLEGVGRFPSYSTQKLHALHATSREGSMMGGEVSGAARSAMLLQALGVTNLSAGLAPSSSRLRRRHSTQGKVDADKLLEQLRYTAGVSHAADHEELFAALSRGPDTVLSDAQQRVGSSSRLAARPSFVGASLPSMRFSGAGSSVTGLPRPHIMSEPGSGSASTSAATAAAAATAATAAAADSDLPEQGNSAADGGGGGGGVVNRTFKALQNALTFKSRGGKREEEISEGDTSRLAPRAGSRTRSGVHSFSEQLAGRAGSVASRGGSVTGWMGGIAGAPLQSALKRPAGSPTAAGGADLRDSLNEHPEEGTQEVFQSVTDQKGRPLTRPFKRPNGDNMTGPKTPACIPPGSDGDKLEAINLAEISKPDDFISRHASYSSAFGGPLMDSPKGGSEQVKDEEIFPLRSLARLQPSSQSLAELEAELRGGAGPAAVVAAKGSGKAPLKLEGIMGGVEKGALSDVAEEASPGQVSRVGSPRDGGPTRSWVASPTPTDNAASKQLLSGGRRSMESEVLPQEASMSAAAAVKSPHGSLTQYIFSPFASTKVTPELDSQAPAHGAPPSAGLYGSTSSMGASSSQVTAATNISHRMDEEPPHRDHKEHRKSTPPAAITSSAAGALNVRQSMIRGKGYHEAARREVRQLTGEAQNMVQEMQDMGSTLNKLLQDLRQASSAARRPLQGGKKEL